MRVEAPLSVEQRWTLARDTLTILDGIRPNPKNILSATLKLEHGYRALYDGFYSATTEKGKKYCFIDWVANPDEVSNYYYSYQNGNGLAFQPRLQERLDVDGFTAKRQALEEEHDYSKGKLKLTSEEFLAFLTKNDILVSGPCPAPVETVIQGKGMGLWMPEELFRLTSYYDWHNRSVEQTA